jgi:hypothetical protein
VTVAYVPHTDGLVPSVADARLVNQMFRGSYKPA